MYKSSNNKQVTLDNVNLKEEIKNMKGIAIMLEQDDGTYIESSTNTFPTDMKFNSELSGCIDNLGNRIEDSLTYENGIANVETNSTSYCYLYFSLDKLATEEIITNAGNDLWKSTLEDDEYRFVGINPDNYICFGTTDESECVIDEDKYMYRIIGIFEDSSGEQHLKLIKKEALNPAYAWNADYQTDIAWEESDLYNGLNGSYFLTSTDYSYMQDSNWTDKIAIWDYTATNTLTNESSGMSYYSSVVRQTYLHEMNRSTKTSSVGIWDTVPAKIGLMYVSDYQLSLGSTALDYTNSNSTDYALMKTGWMHISNNDSGAPSQNEWTISRYGSSGGWHAAWGVDSNGNVNYYYVPNSISVRPVFYLTSDVKITGTGTIKNPYMINNPSVDTTNLNITAEELIKINPGGLWESTLEDDGYRYIGGNPDNYICFGTKSKSECTENNDLYMYRIIGIFEDSSGEQHLKLIKKSVLSTKYAWQNGNGDEDVDWDESDLYNGINGSYFLTNTTYSYMQNTNWTNKIATWNYTATNTLEYENSGIEYYSNTSKAIYLHEMNRSSKTSQTCYQYDWSTTTRFEVDCNVGEWKTVSTKIGLMYVSDFMLSLGSSSLEYTSYNNADKYLNSWIHEKTAPGAVWTMSRLGLDDTKYEGFIISCNSLETFINEYRIDIGMYIKPVFYLTSDVKISGKGTIGSPYIIS